MRIMTIMLKMMMIRRDDDEDTDPEVDPGQLPVRGEELLVVHPPGVNYRDKRRIREAEWLDTLAKPLLYDSSNLEPAGEQI
jgi:hypothetical protein